ncbi:ribonuclease P/MRP protein subunit POP5 [Microcaecilia unicolor]|uniref:Ribonuclease P/MRP protein subunit POP5 n=1 Tax=Microcaecilia unicolor TaxID=1415580 RepID=A0A6P7ZAM1_9AMPH|nr:ribonuclease P/MRP protein subunit POP5 [Microcaecilia unicolor]
MVRFKSRYLLCEIVVDDPLCRQIISQGLVHSTLKEALIRAHGDFGFACCSVSFAVKYVNAYTGIVLIRCRKAFYQLFWSSLPFITCLESRGQRFPCFFNTLHVSGTIRTCQKYLIQYNQKQLLRLLQNSTSDVERKLIERSIRSSLEDVDDEEDGQRSSEDELEHQ